MSLTATSTSESRLFQKTGSSARAWTRGDRAIDPRAARASRRLSVMIHLAPDITGVASPLGEGSMKTLVLAFSVVLCASQEKGQWVPISESVTSKVKTAWPGLTAGIAVDPSTGDVYMAVSGAGLYKSTDKGATFERCDGEMVGGRCETGAALCVDPERPGRIACFMLDGKSARTLDGGKTWVAINDKSRGFDYVAVDWSDPKARRMFGVRHESGEIGLLSEDGATWKVLDKPWKAFGSSISTRSSRSGARASSARRTAARPGR